jgi:hypothetical protein
VKTNKPKKIKKDKPMKQWQLEELMGAHDSVYKRTKGGALKQK